MRLTAISGVAWLLALLMAARVLAMPAPLASLPGLSAEECAAARQVSDAELDEMRGRYAGYYFSADMSGYWDSLGNQQAALNTATNIALEQVPVVPPSGPSVDLSHSAIPDVRIHAFIGSLQNTSGLIQITQVPGNNNVITSVMNLKIMVVNVADGSRDLSNLLPQLMAGF